MLSRNFYEIVHILGIALIFAAIGGVAVHAANGGTRATSRTRELLASVHGGGAFLILLGGFGMLARLGFRGTLADFPGWLWVKIIIWTVLGGLTLLPYRRPQLAKPFILLMPLLAALAAYMAVYKPF